MKKNILTLLFIFFCFFYNFNAQNIPLANKKKFSSKINLNETIYVHTNSSLFLTGEDIYYNIYCLSSKNKLSQYSKVAYLDIINQEKEVVFSTKVSLDNGIGYGNYFIPNTFKSGNYKLVSYTNWMKNGQQKNYFQSNITIINTYSNQQSALLPKSQTTKVRKHLLPKELTLKSDLLELKIGRDIFSKRDSVLLKFNSKNSNAYGYYSISINKVDSLNYHETKNFVDMSFVNENYLNKPFLPELRGELFKGKVNSDDINTAISDRHIYISTYGDLPTSQIVSTDKNGNFYFNLNSQLANRETIFQVADNMPKNISIKVFSKKENYHSLENYSSFYLTYKMKQRIINRSIHNQINNYYKINKVLEIKPKNSFFNKPDNIFILDDYTRFPTIKETVLEVVKGLTLKKIGKENYSFRIVSKYNHNITYKPIVFFDGILIDNHNDILKFPAKKIKSFRLYKGNYLIGSKFVSGILYIESIGDEFYKKNQIQLVDKLNLLRVEPKKKYIFPNHHNNTLNNIPDFRHQLFWKPKIHLNKKELSFLFYTSDLIGRYKISLQGITINGERVSIIDYFNVE